MYYQVAIDKATCQWNLANLLATAEAIESLAYGEAQDLLAELANYWQDLLTEFVSAELDEQEV